MCTAIGQDGSGLGVGRKIDTGATIAPTVTEDAAPVQLRLRSPCGDGGVLRIVGQQHHFRGDGPIAPRGLEAPLCAHVAKLLDVHGDPAAAIGREIIPAVRPCAGLPVFGMARNAYSSPWQRLTCIVQHLPTDNRGCDRINGTVLYTRLNGVGRLIEEGRVLCKRGKSGGGQRRSLGDGIGGKLPIIADIQWKDLSLGMPCIVLRL